MFLIITDVSGYHGTRVRRKCPAVQSSPTDTCTTGAPANEAKLSIKQKVVRISSSKTNLFEMSHKRFTSIDNSGYMAFKFYQDGYHGFRKDIDRFLNTLE